MKGKPMRRTNCNHSEGRDEGGFPLPGDSHDCDYVDARNRLIPQAEKIAIGVACQEISLPENRGSNKWDQAWVRAFHAAMTKLARETGLTA